SSTSEILQARVTQRIIDLGLTARSVSITVTGRPDLVRFIFTRGTVPSGDNLLGLAAALQCSPNWLLGKSDEMASDSDAELRGIDHLKRVRASEEFKIRRDYNEIAKEMGHPLLKEPSKSALHESPIPAIVEMPKDIPVY